MAIKRRMAAPVAEDPEEEVEAVEEEVEEVDAEDVEVLDDEDEDADEVIEAEEEEEEAPAPKAVKKAVIPPQPKKVVVPPAPATKQVAKPATKPAAQPVAAAPTKKVVVPPAPAKAAAPVAKKATAPAPVVEEAEVEEAPKPLKITKVGSDAVASLLAAAMNHLEDGQSLLITNLGEGKFSVGPADAKKLKAANKVSGQAYWETVCEPDYLKWEKEWLQLTAAEKLARAKKAGAKWEHSDDPRVDQIHMTAAYREVMGIEKYKPEYRTKAARAAVRGGNAAE